MKIVHEVH